MGILTPTAKSNYTKIVELCKKSHVYYRHSFCGTKNKDTYLKIVARKGMHFTNEELVYINNYVYSLVGDRYKMNYNIKSGTLSLKINEEG